MIGTLSGEEIDRLLHTQRIGRLACSVDDQPYVVPITYGYDGRYVYAYSSAGRKIDVMRRQPNVCFQVDEITGPSSWRSVVATGEYEELTKDVDRRTALKALVPLGSEPVSRGLDGGSKVVVFRIRLTDRTGRFERRDA